jgi:iron complex outermembrane receptor protein
MSPSVYSALFQKLSFHRGVWRCAFPLLPPLIILTTSHAQVAPSEPDSDPLRLPEFEVRDTRSGAIEATSTTRISIPIFELAQSVSVVTRELIDDTQGARMIDVARFLTPITESPPGAGDIYTVRGFRTQGKFMDGVTVGATANSMWSDQTNLERLEIIKGPNAILVPGGLAGGIINQITKSPRFEPFTTLTLRARSYLGSHASLDHNAVFGGDSRTAARLVATVWDSDGYFNGQFRRGWLVAPSFAHRFRNGAKLILKVESLENHESNGMGVTIDPAVGTRIGGYARKHPLLPRNNLFPPLDSERYRRETRATAELRTTIAGDIAARFWVMFDHAYFSTPSPLGRYAAGNQINPHPLTGEWEPFRRFTYEAATGTVKFEELTPSTSTLFTRRNQTLFTLEFDEVHLKNDWAKEYGFGETGRGTTVAGVNLNGQFNVKTQTWQISRDPLDYATGRPVGADTIRSSTLVRDKGARQLDAQGFVYQRFNLLNDRFIISGGAAFFHGELERTDDSELPPHVLDTTRNQVTDVNFGAVWKPTSEVALFAGYNRTGGALPLSTTAGEYGTTAFEVGVGDQWEFGVKTSWLHNRITTSACYSTSTGRTKDGSSNLPRR